MSNIVIKPATKAHLPFIGTALMLSERSHVSKGLWDVILHMIPDEQRAEVMAYVAEHDPTAHFHMSRYFVAEDESTGLPVATACVFPYPDFKVSISTAAIGKALQEKFHVSSEDVEGIDPLTAFLDDSFPDIDYDQSYMVESVYTLPSHRGQRLAPRLIEHIIQHYCLAEGEGALGYKKMLISCAVGNDSGRRAYEAAGFTLMGSGHSERCTEALGFPGFYMLRRDLKSPLSLQGPVLMPPSV